MFELDKLIVSSIKNLMSDAYLQFATLVGLFVIAHIVCPKKVKK